MFSLQAPINTYVPILFFESDTATEDAVYAIDFTLASSVVSERFPRHILCLR